jgi:hypothetical protein
MKSYKRRNMLTIRWTLGLMLSTIEGKICFVSVKTSCQSTRTYYPDSKPTSLCSFFSSCTAFILEATNSNFIIFGLTQQEQKICRTGVFCICHVIVSVLVPSAADLLFLLGQTKDYKIGIHNDWIHKSLLICLFKCVLIEIFSTFLLIIDI